MTNPTDWQTTRQFPRSLQQAWPREHANPIEFHPRRISRRANVAAAIVLGVVVAVIGVRAVAGA